ncbi:MAG: hypothetical protein IBJ00_01065, partial [Alphaproteobacteria bacterium]|nr:hypothetical protein [Alphaproteobacteria bacterium]
KDSAAPEYFKIINKWHLDQGKPAYLDADSGHPEGRVYRSGYDCDNTKWKIVKDSAAPEYFKIINKWHLDQGKPAYLDADSGHPEGRVYRSGYDSDNTRWKISTEPVEPFFANKYYFLQNKGLRDQNLIENVVIGISMEEAPEKKDNRLVIKDEVEVNRLWFKGLEQDDHDHFDPAPPYKYWLPSFIIEQSEVPGCYTLKHENLKGLVTYIPKEYAPGKKDHMLVIRDWDEYKPGGKCRYGALFSIEASEIKGCYTLYNKGANGLVTYVPKQYAPGKKDHTLVIRDWDEYKPGGKWRRAALFYLTSK